MRQLPVTLTVVCISAIMPGEYPGTVYVPAAPGALTLYGTGDKPIDVKISEAIDSEMDRNTWRRLVNPGGKYMPGKPAWYMFDSCQSKSAATVGVMCSAVFWSQNNGLQLQRPDHRQQPRRQR